MQIFLDFSWTFRPMLSFERKSQISLNYTSGILVDFAQNLHLAQMDINR